MINRLFAHLPLAAMTAPLMLAVVVIFSVARPPHELFQALPKKSPSPAPIEVDRDTPVEPEQAPPPLESLVESLAPDAASESGLASLTAGVVAAGSGGTGVEVQQGQVNTAAVLQRVSEEQRSPKLLTSSAPQYPSQAQNQGIEGFVILKLQVLEDGRVGEVKVEKAQPPGVFEAAALRAVRTWKFSAGFENGKPAIMWVKHKVNFALD